MGLERYKYRGCLGLFTPPQSTLLGTIQVSRMKVLIILAALVMVASATWPMMGGGMMRMGYPGFYGMGGYGMGGYGMGGYGMGGYGMGGYGMGGYGMGGYGMGGYGMGGYGMPGYGMGGYRMYGWGYPRYMPKSKYGYYK